MVHWPLMGGLLYLVQRAGAWGRGAAASPNPLLAVPNVTAHPSTVSVPTSYYSTWHYNCHFIEMLSTCVRHSLYMIDWETRLNTHTHTHTHSNAKSVYNKLVDSEAMITSVSETIWEVTLADRCYHVANDLTNFTGDRQIKRQTDGQTNRWTASSRKALTFVSGGLTRRRYEVVWVHYE